MGSRPHPYASTGFCFGSCKKTRCFRSGQERLVPIVVLASLGLCVSPTREKSGRTSAEPSGAGSSFSLMTFHPILLEWAWSWVHATSRYWASKQLFYVTPLWVCQSLHPRYEPQAKVTNLHKSGDCSQPACLQKAKAHQAWS